MDNDNNNYLSENNNGNLSNCLPAPFFVTPDSDPTSDLETSLNTPLINDPTLDRQSLVNYDTPASQSSCNSLLNFLGKFKTSLRV